MPTAFSSPTPHELPWLIRADFTDQAAWDDVRLQSCIDLTDPDREVGSEFLVADDVTLDGLTPQLLLELEPAPGVVYFLVDHLTITHPDHPLLAVDVTPPGSSFRLVPSAVQGFLVQMSLANMDFDDFADNVDADGIFRDFRDPAPADLAGPLPARTPPADVSGPVPPVVPAEPDRDGAEADRAHPVGSIADLVREAKPDEPDSFIGELIRTGFWNPASWQRLEAGMRAACHQYSGADEVPRTLTRAFHSVVVRVPNLVSTPRFIRAGDPAALDARLRRISVLGSWFFQGWSMDRPDAPLPGEYDPTASHG